MMHLRDFSETHAEEEGAKFVPGMIDRHASEASSSPAAGGINLARLHQPRLCIAHVFCMSP
jgi:hypothetical protein